MGLDGVLQDEIHVPSPRGAIRLRACPSIPAEMSAAATSPMGALRRAAPFHSPCRTPPQIPAPSPEGQPVDEVPHGRAARSPMRRRSRVDPVVGVGPAPFAPPLEGAFPEAEETRQRALPRQASLQTLSETSGGTGRRRPRHAGRSATDAAGAGRAKCFPMRSRMPSRGSRLTLPNERGTRLQGHTSPLPSM